MRQPRRRWLTHQTTGDKVTPLLAALLGGDPSCISQYLHMVVTSSVLDAHVFDWLLTAASKDGVTPLHAAAMSGSAGAHR